MIYIYIYNYDCRLCYGTIYQFPFHNVLIVLLHAATYWNISFNLSLCTSSPRCPVLNIIVLCIHMHLYTSVCMCVCVHILYKFSKLVAACIILQKSELLGIGADVHRNQPS